MFQCEGEIRQVKQRGMQAGAQSGLVVPQPVGPPSHSDPQKTTAAAKAKASKTNRDTVERMDMLKRRRPDLAELVQLGKLKPQAALRLMRRDELGQNRLAAEEACSGRASRGSVK